MEPEILGPRRPTQPTSPLTGRTQVQAATLAESQWQARTYADVLRERGEPDNVQVRCPGCGRTRPAWAVIDARSVSPEVRGDAEWACDVCRVRWERGGADMGAIVEALGAPPTVVLEARGATDV